jgi:hypothetical protein
MLAPIVIFGYKRPDSLRITIESLLNCQYANQSELFIFCDGPKNIKDIKAVTEVRDYLQNVKGFKNITLKFSEKNRGLAQSIIEGVSKIHETYDSVIVLEDDLVVSANFLVYMNKALDFYRDNKKIFSIAGYSIPITKAENYKYDVYFTPRASSWGWASWKDRWEKIDWNVSDFNEFKKNKKQIEAFNKGGSDLFNMLNKRMNGKIDSWAIRWCYSQFKANLFTVYPIISKVQNTGFDVQATNSNVYNRYYTELDAQLLTEFIFSENAMLDNWSYEQFADFYNLKNRLLGRIRTIIHKLGFLKNK